MPFGHVETLALGYGVFGRQHLGMAAGTGSWRKGFGYHFWRVMLTVAGERSFRYSTQ